MIQLDKLDLYICSSTHHDTSTRVVLALDDQVSYFSYKLSNLVTSVDNFLLALTTTTPIEHKVQVVEHRDHGEGA